jgi:hypothetical protein
MTAIESPARDSTRSADPTATSRRILFSVRNFWFLKYYDSVLRMLAERGHRVHVVGDRKDVDQRFPKWMAAIESLAAEYPTVTYGWMPRRPKDEWSNLALWTNRLADYARFLEPQFDRAPFLRQRAARHVSGTLRAVMEWRWPGQALLGRSLERLLAALDRAVAPTGALEQMLLDQQPDLVIVSPLVTLGSRQSDLLRAARHVGIPAIFAAGSWDHLSSKARVRELPDAVFVWNQTQRREAMLYHDVPEDRIVITGAQCFDQWFDRAPSRDRATFCRDRGLPADRPIVLYVCSSLFWGSPVEAEFALRWAGTLRSSDHPSLRDASILIRPHPKRGAEWQGADVAALGNTRVWPPLGDPPLAVQAKADYFDSLYHADAIVGLNTSAQIEGALIGRPVYTILLPEFWDNQEGTLHFHYLLEQSGGPLQASRSFEEHVCQLAEGLDNPRTAAGRNRAFVESFVRPRGIDRSATSVFADAVERLAAQRVSPATARWAAYRTRLTRALMLPLAYALRLTPAANSTGRRALNKAWSDEMARLSGPRTVKVSRVRRTKSEPREARARAKAPANARKVERPVRTALPPWAWSLRAVVYPVVKRVDVAGLGDERLWRQARYAQKEAEREARRLQAEALRAQRANASKITAAGNRAARRKSPKPASARWKRRLRGRVAGIALRLGIIARPSEPPPPVQPS